MTTDSIAPTAISTTNTINIMLRYSRQTSPVAEASWVTRSKSHCNLMAPMSNDRRIEYLEKAGCNEDSIQLITHAVADIMGRTAKPGLKSAAHECVKDEEDIGILLEKWPRPEHLQTLASKIANLTKEQMALATAYAACQIYEIAATALYLTIIDGTEPASTEEPSGPETKERDRTIADAGYNNEVARWPK